MLLISSYRMWLHILIHKHTHKHNRTKMEGDATDRIYVFMFQIFWPTACTFSEKIKWKWECVCAHIQLLKGAFISVEIKFCFLILPFSTEKILFFLFNWWGKKEGGGGYTWAHDVTHFSSNKASGWNRRASVVQEDIRVLEGISPWISKTTMSPWM